MRRIISIEPLQKLGCVFSEIAIVMRIRVSRDRKKLKSRLRAKVRHDLDEMRKLHGTNAAPGTPKIDHSHFVGQIGFRGRAGIAGQRLQPKSRQCLSNTWMMLTDRFGSWSKAKADN